MTAEKEATSPPKTSTAAVESSPATPAPKRIRMSSPTKENATTTDSTAQPEQQTELTTAPTASSAAEGTSVHNRVEDDDDLEVVGRHHNKPCTVCPRLMLSSRRMMNLCTAETLLWVPIIRTPLP